MSADAKLKTYIDRILRCREAEDLAKEDTKAVYAELAGDGYEKAIVGQVVTFLRKREKDGDKLSEQSAKFDLYLEAYERPSHAHTRVRADEDVSPRLIKQVVDGMQTKAGRAALLTAVDVMIEREEVEERRADDRRSDAGLDIVTRHTEIATTPETAEKAEPAEAAVTVGDDLREPVAAEQGQIIREGDALREAGRHDDGDASCPDTYSPELAIECAAPEEDAAAGERGDEATVEQRSPAPNPVLAPNSHEFYTESVPRRPMKRLHYAHCFPELTPTEWRALSQDIVRNGIQKPIIRMDDTIIDGWDRYCVAREHGLEYPVREYRGNDVLLDVIGWQRASRNFAPAQEKKIAAELAKEIPHRSRDIMAALGMPEALVAAE